MIEGSACTESLQLGVGEELRRAPMWGIHSWLFRAPSDGLRIGRGSGGNMVGEVSLPAYSSNCKLLGGLEQSQHSFPPPLSLLLPTALNSPAASLLPDVASRCVLEQFQVDQGCRGSSQAPGISSSLLQWGLPDALPPLPSFHQ